MKQIKANTSVIELYRNGMIKTRTLNSCRRKRIESVADIVKLSRQYGSLREKFGPSQMCQELEMILSRTAA